MLADARSRWGGETNHSREMLEVTYASKEEKYSIVASFMRMLERECQRIYELIPEEDVDMRAAFETFHIIVSANAKDATKMLDLWEHTYDSWLEIEPEEPNEPHETLMHINRLLNIGGYVHFLKLIAIDLAKFDFVWIVHFKFGDWKLRWQRDEKQNPKEFEEKCVHMSTLDRSMEIFTSIRDLISHHDDGLRSSAEVYSRVRKCFDMLYEYNGEGEKTELSYHAMEVVENWRLRGGVKGKYAAILESVKRELADACAAYHKLPTRLLQYETYCAFMETYRMCMKDGNMDAYPTETIQNSP